MPIRTDACVRMTFDSRKRYLTIIDGIIGGEGNGPIDVDPVASGVLLLSTDPVAADAVAARLMGFDPRKIPIIARAAQLADYRLGAASLDEIEVVSNHGDWCGKLNAIDFSEQKRFPSSLWLARQDRNGYQR